MQAKRYAKLNETMKSNFWRGFLEALDCKVQDINELQGASGIRHKVLCVGVDENRRRLIIVQDEHDARVLAMVQADVQARIKGNSVLMIRPISINLATVFGSMALLLGGSKLTHKEIIDLSEKDETNEKANEAKQKFESLISFVSPQLDIIQRTKPNIVSVVQETVGQLSHLKFLQHVDEKDFAIDFEEIINYNPVVYDNDLGICSIPLFLFSVEEAESFLDKKNMEVNKLILKKHGIYQFFYPPIDSLALGLVETGLYKPEDLITCIEKVPKIGHPFGENELTDIKKLNDVVDALKDKGLVVEGEFSLGVTEDGKDKRMLVKFSPRESIFKRIANIISVKVDLNLKDFFK